MIEIRDLKKTYHVGDVDVHALRGVDLSVARGEFVTVIGPSGSGKSTLFHILGGLTPPTSGAIQFDGRDLLSMTEAERTELRKSTVGFVFQKYNLLPTLTAADNIEIARDIAGRGKESDPRFAEILKLLGIEGPTASQAARTFGRRAAARGHRSRTCKPSCPSAGRRTYRKPGHRKFHRGVESTPRPERPSRSNHSDDHA